MNKFDLNNYDEGVSWEEKQTILQEIAYHDIMSGGYDVERIPKKIFIGSGEDVSEELYCD